MATSGLNKIGAGQLELSGNNTFHWNNDGIGGDVGGPETPGVWRNGTGAGERGILDVSAQSMTLGSFALNSGGTSKLDVASLLSVSGSASLNGLINVAGDGGCCKCRTL